MSASVEHTVLSGRGLCDGLIAYPEETWPSVVCLCVILKPRLWGGLCPSRAVMPQEKQVKALNNE